MRGRRDDDVCRGLISLDCPSTAAAAAAAAEAAAHAAGDDDIAAVAVTVPIAADVVVQPLPTSQC
jgi:hypothetical protein